MNEDAQRALQKARILRQQCGEVEGAPVSGGKSRDGERNVLSVAMAEVDALASAWHDDQIARGRRLVDLLTHELNQRALWEGVSFSEAVRNKKLEVNALAEDENNRRQREQEQSAVDGMRDLAAQLGRQHGRRVAEYVRERRVERERQLRTDNDTERESWTTDLETQSRKTVDDLQSHLSSAREQHTQQADKLLSEVEHDVREVERRVEHAADAHRARRAAHRLCAAALAVRPSLVAAESSASSDGMPTAGKRSKMDAQGLRRAAVEMTTAAEGAGAAAAAQAAGALCAALDGMPSAASESPLASEYELRQRFVTVAREAQKAAMVPEGAGRAGALLHLFAGVFERLKITPRGRDEGAGADRALHRAEAHNARGELAAAVTEVQTLKGLAAALCEDWLRLARLHVLTRQAVAVSLSEAAVILS